MLWLALALTPILYGIGDYFAGDTAKRVRPIAIVGFTSAVSFVFALGWAYFAGELVWDAGPIFRGMASGAFYLLANCLFYIALSLGKSGVVGAIISLSVVPAVISDSIRGELPSPLQMLGIVGILVGVTFVSVPEVSKRVSKAAVLIALAAAMVLGIQYTVLGRASTENSDVAIMMQYLTAFSIVAVIGLTRRTMGGVNREESPRLLFLGLTFGLAGILLSTALSGINVAVVTAVLNCEPIVLAALGFFLAKQRLSRLQTGALGVVVIGVILATAG